MAVKITYGNPYRWRRWVVEGNPHVSKGMVFDRPDPASWYFEARYHHTGSWRLGLDFRPKDGKMPDMWEPPFLWRPAWEIMEVEQKLQKDPSMAVLDLTELPIPDMLSWVTQIDDDLHDYADAIKKKKKLLFGSPQGMGAAKHKIMGPADEAVLSVKSQSGLAEAIKKYTLPPNLAVSDGDEIKFSVDKPVFAGHPMHYFKWQVDGIPIPYNPLIFKHTQSVPISIEVVGMHSDPMTHNWVTKFKIHLGGMVQYMSYLLSAEQMKQYGMPIPVWGVHKILFDKFLVQGKIRMEIWLRLGDYTHPVALDWKKEIAPDKYDNLLKMPLPGVIQNVEY